MAERQSAEKTKRRKRYDRKTKGRNTQDRADIWPKRRLTENYIRAKNISSKKKYGQQTVDRIDITYRRHKEEQPLFSLV